MTAVRCSVHWPGCVFWGASGPSKCALLGPAASISCQWRDNHVTAANPVKSWLLLVCQCSFAVSKVASAAATLDRQSDSSVFHFQKTQSAYPAGLCWVTNHRTCRGSSSPASLNCPSARLHSALSCCYWQPHQPHTICNSPPAVERELLHWLTRSPCIPFSGPPVLLKLAPKQSLKA